MTSRDLFCVQSRLWSKHSVLPLLKSPFGLSIRQSRLYYSHHHWKQCRNWWEQFFTPTSQQKKILGRSASINYSGYLEKYHSVTLSHPPNQIQFRTTSYFPISMAPISRRVGEPFEFFSLLEKLGFSANWQTSRNFLCPGIVCFRAKSKVRKEFKITRHFFSFSGRILLGFLEKWHANSQLRLEVLKDLHWTSEKNAVLPSSVVGFHFPISSRINHRKCTFCLLRTSRPVVFRGFARGRNEIGR